MLEIVVLEEEMNMTTMFVAITGTQGSGKSVFTEIAKKKYNIPTYRMGNIIVEECESRGLDINGRNMAKMASVLRYEGGDHAIAKKSLPALKELKKKNPKIIIIDGVRSYNELALFKEELGNVVLVAIVASLNVRKNRVESRKRIDVGSIFDFEEREHRELGFGLGNVITQADYFIHNENISKNKFINEIETLIKKISEESNED